MPNPKQAPEAAALRRALRATARAWADSGSGSPWRAPRLSLSSAELLPCAPAVALLALGASMLLLVITLSPRLSSRATVASRS